MFRLLREAGFLESRRIAEARGCVAAMLAPPPFAKGEASRLAELREAKPPLRRRGGVEAGGIEGGQGPHDDDNRREDDVTAGGARLLRTTRNRRQGEASRLAWWN
jgi:hypothetical protein